MHVRGFLMAEQSKKVRRRLRDLAAIAYERELSRELDSLFKDFEAWKREELDPFELSDKIHEFHQKPSRELFKWYTDQHPDFPVAKATADGILSEQEVGEEILSILEGLIPLRRKSIDNDSSKD